MIPLYCTACGGPLTAAHTCVVRCAGRCPGHAPASVASAPQGARRVAPAPNPTAQPRRGGLQALAGLLALVLAGCPIRVDPPGPDQCHQRPTCEQCASQPECSWCVTGDGRQGCYVEAGSPTDCAPRVTVADLCPQDARSERVPTSSGN